MVTNINKIKLKGHESFYIREGWLGKGINGVLQNPYIFSDTTKAVDELGVGANMVKSIRFWLQAVGLTKEIRGNGGKRIQELTDGFGNIIEKYDKYFEDLGSLFLLHYKLVINQEIATSWFVFFNRVKASEMSKTSMKGAIKQQILNINPSTAISDKSLIDDCNCIIKTYSIESNDLKNPEDNMICPFTDLGLIKRISVRGKEDLIIKLSPNKKKLDRLIVLYVIMENLGERESISVNNLIYDEKNIGKVFNLDKNTVNEYIDILEGEGYININRTAGLNTVYPTKLVNNILDKYYSGF